MSWTSTIQVDALLEAEEIGIASCAEHEYRCHCPFHDDGHPSFSINAVSTQWWCFACGLGGNAITLVAMLHDLDREGAKDYLVSRHGAEFSRGSDTRWRSHVAEYKRRHGLVLAGRKPGVTNHDLMLRRKRILDVAFAGIHRTKLRRWIESEFPIGKREANQVIRNLIDGGRLMVDPFGFVRSTPRDFSLPRKEQLPTSESSTETGSTPPPNCPPDPFAVHDPSRRARIADRQRRLSGWE
jgi:CHC2-type zinc finger protein